MRALLSVLIALSSASPLAAATLVVGNKAENTVSFIDLASGRERARLPTGTAPHEVALSPDGRQAAVVAYGGKQIDLYDVAAAKHLATIDLGSNTRPHGLVWLKNSGRLVATTEGSGTVVVVDPARRVVEASIPTGAKVSHMVTVTADEQQAFVTNLGSGNVTAVDLGKGTKIADISAGLEPEGLALTPDGRELWVANRGDDTVTVFDASTRKPLTTLAVGDMPIRLQISPDGRTAVTSNARSADLTLIDVATRKVQRTVPLEGGADAMPVTILFSSDGKRLFVAETGQARVAEVDLAAGRVVRRLGAGKGADGLGYSPVTGASSGR